ncbi:hypothetical protein RQP46_002229 [Phenoliferia psychrophenolica]
MIHPSTLIERAFTTEHPFVTDTFTDKDLKISTLAFGWTLGFGFFVAWHAIQQTKKLTLYTTLVWLEIFACNLIGTIKHSFAFYMIILTCWAIQVQLLLQIIINRICLLWPNVTQQRQLKYSVAGIITAINVVVYCIWVPARLQISAHYIALNVWWDRLEKCLYLVVDAYLNYLFIRTGLERYRPLVRFNIQLIIVSIAMDVLIIGMMSYSNSFVYMQFHPVAYLVKLNIELALSSMIVDIASAKRSKAPQQLEYTAEALQIAVHTVTHSTAVQLDDLGGDGEKLRTTRTPARPDLAERLKKMRREKKEREGHVGGSEDGEIVMHTLDRGSKWGRSTENVRGDLDEKKVTFQ